MSRLSTRILVSQVVILFVTMCIGFGLYAWITDGQLDQQYQQRALVIAESVATMPEVQQALLHEEISPTSDIEALASRIQHATGANFVVIADPAGTRLTHPLPALVGKWLGEPVYAMDG
ncbi:MAG TPA: sensor histidine kinase, partial [Pseudonocardiaceae bacterium]|nr:sensor histidine kinase [Pseudonocardiaceae bacterium]